MVAHLRLLAAIALVATAAAQSPDVFDLEPADVVRLEAQLKSNPEDLSARRALIQYHQRADRVNFDRAEVTRHTLWVIEHHPDSDILRFVHFAPGQLSSADYQRAVTLWTSAPKSAEAQSNAAQFFNGLDENLHLRYLEATVTANPDHAGAIRALAFIYARALIDPGPFTAHAQSALDTSKNRWILGNTAYTLQSLYNEKLQRGETNTRITQLAEKYFLQAKAIDPSMDRNAILPQLGPPRPVEQAPPPPPVRHLAIEAFPQLPAPIANVLRSRGCTIPEDNVIRGQFFRNSEFGWAVYCSKNGTTALLAFRNDRDTQPETVVTHTDPYAHSITTVEPQEFLRRYRMMGGPVPPAILDHQGIDDGFGEKASVRWYFHDGKWTQYPGAD